MCGLCLKIRMATIKITSMAIMYLRKSGKQTFNNTNKNIK